MCSWRHLYGGSQAYLYRIEKKHSKSVSHIARQAVKTDTTVNLWQDYRQM
jgi:hypothetical protein